MNRRAFLQSIVGAAVLAAVPIPKILWPTPVQAIPEDPITALNKALSMGPSGLAYGSALQVEDLSMTLRSVTFDDTHIKLWKSHV